MKNRGWDGLRQRLAGGQVVSHVVGMRHRLSTGLASRNHSHAEALEIVFHPTGRGFTTVEGGGRVPFTEGEAVLYAPGLGHDQWMDAAGEDWCVQARMPEGVAVGGHLRIGPIADTTLRAELESLARSLSAATPGAAALLNLRTTAILLHLLELAFARGNPVSARLARHVEAAERYIQEHYDRIESLAEVAGHAGLSHDHLRHLFRRSRGRSLVRYLNEIRVDRARTLLAHTTLTMKEVAAACGFADEYYFSVVFRRLAGVAPGGYRDQHRAKARKPAG